MRHLSLFFALFSLLAPFLPAQTSPSTIMPVRAHGVLCAYWREIPGSRVGDLISLPVYPGYPNEQVVLNRFEIPENQEGNFGTVIRGYVHPPQDGQYTFFIAGNNQCELWLSPDDTPAGKRLIATVPQWSMPQEWTAAPEQQSKPVQLTKGGNYYIEARHKNGGGDNHLSVAWKLPDGTLQGPIPGEYLTPAAPVVVPPPVATLPEMPVAAGRYRLKVQVNYLLQNMSVPVLLTLPSGYSASGRLPAIVFLADTDQEADAEGYRVQGPDKLALTDPLLKFVSISPQVPAGSDYTQRVTLKAMAAVMTEISKRIGIDRQRIGLTGVATGGTAAWSVAMEMPGFYFAVSPVNGREVHDPELTRCLRGTFVRIYTDIAEGFATGCANRMNEALADLDPKPQIIYLGEKELGKGPAADYCYALPAFYEQLLSAPKPPAAAQAAPAPRWTLWVVGLGIATGIAVLIYLWLRRRSGHQGV